MNHPVLAIDYGEARIGLAATDELGIAAHAIGTIHCRTEEPFPALLKIISERNIQQVVLGLPLRMDGAEGKSSAKVRGFGCRLRKQLGNIPLAYFDERFTTITAAEKLRSAGKNAKKQKAIIDQAAALEILNDYLGWTPDQL